MALYCSKKLSALLRETLSKHNSDFYCFDCLYSFRTKTKFESHKKLCENNDFCNVVMPSEDAKVLDFNEYRRYDKEPVIIYADVESLMGKIRTCKIIYDKSK